MENGEGEAPAKPEIAKGQVPLLPNFQVQIQNPNQRVQLPNEQVLKDVIKEGSKEGNSSEAQVALQIILISAAILAIVGGLALNNNASHFSTWTGVLLVFAVIGLGGSLFAGVLHFITERHFWYKTRQRGIEFFKYN